MKIASEKITRRPARLLTQTLAADVLSNGYLVSTINCRINEDLAALDGLIGVVQTLAGVPDEENMAAPGQYETMVFDCDPETGEVGDYAHLDFARYGTEDAAREGHEAHVAKWMQR